jgi:hypothetical protein
VTTDWRTRAFDQVNEITKQVLTLATGIIALTLTFVKDFVPGASAGARNLLAWSWFVYILSIIAGFLTLMASAGLQQEGSGPNKPLPSINSGNLRLFGAAQLILFLVALGMTVGAGAWATWS